MFRLFVENYFDFVIKHLSGLTTLLSVSTAISDLCCYVSLLFFSRRQGREIFSLELIIDSRLEKVRFSSDLCDERRQEEDEEKNTRAHASNFDDVQ